MIKNLMIAAISFATLGTASAQDTKSDALLNAVSSKLKSAKSIKANFVLAMKNSKGATQNTMRGTFLMKGDKYVVDLGGQKIINDGKTVYTYLKKNNEVQISNFNPAEAAISPAKLFSGNFTSDYKYKYDGQRSYKGGVLDVVELRPKSNNRGFDRVELYVDKNNTIVGGNVYEKTGNYYSYSISNVNTSTTVSDVTFQFNKDSYKNVEVIDLR